MNDEELFKRLRASRRPEDRARLDFLLWLRDAADTRADPRRIDHTEADKYFFETIHEANEFHGITDEDEDEQ